MAAHQPFSDLETNQTNSQASKTHLPPSASAVPLPSSVHSDFSRAALELKESKEVAELAKAIESSELRQKFELDLRKAPIHEVGVFVDSILVQELMNAMMPFTESFKGSETTSWKEMSPSEDLPEALNPPEKAKAATSAAIGDALALKEKFPLWLKQNFARVISLFAQKNASGNVFILYRAYLYTFGAKELSEVLKTEDERNPEFIKITGQILLIAALIHDHHSLRKFLLKERNLPVNFTLPFIGCSPLQVVTFCSKDSPSFIKEKQSPFEDILERNPDMDCLTLGNNTTLGVACFGVIYGNTDEKKLEVLLVCGANPFYHSKDTPFFIQTVRQHANGLLDCALNLGAALIKPEFRKLPEANAAGDKSKSQVTNDPSIIFLRAMVGRKLPRPSPLICTLIHEPKPQRLLGEEEALESAPFLLRSANERLLQSNSGYFCQWTPKDLEKILDPRTKFFSFPFLGRYHAAIGRSLLSTAERKPQIFDERMLAIWRQAVELNSDPEYILERSTNQDTWLKNLREKMQN